MKCEELALQLQEARRVNAEIALQKENEWQAIGPKAENEWTKKLEDENTVLKGQIAEYKEKMMNDANMIKDLERQVYLIFLHTHKTSTELTLSCAKIDLYCYTAQDTSILLQLQGAKFVCLPACKSVYHF